MESRLTSQDILEQNKKNIVFLMSFFAMYVIVYGYMSLRLGLAVEEATYIYKDWPILLSNGRWGVQLFRFITQTECYLPYAAGILSGIFISAAILIQTYLLKISSSTGRFIYAALYIGCEQWAHQLRYSNQSHAVALGLLLASTAIYLIYNKKGWKSYLLSSGALCLAFSVYQTVGVYAIALVTAVELQKTLTEHYSPFLLRCIKTTSAICIAVILYYCINLAIISFVNIPEATITMVEKYQQNMTGWSDIAKLGVKNIAYQFVNLGIKTPFFSITCQNYQGQLIVASALLPACLIIIYAIKHFGLCRKSILITILVLSVLYIPFTASLLLGKHLPIRVELSNPIPAACLWSLAFSIISRVSIQRAQLAFMSVGIFALIWASCRVSEIGRDERWSYNRGAAELHMMQLRGQQAAINSGLVDCRIVLLGKPRPIPDQLYDIKTTGLMGNETLTDLLRYPGWVTKYARYLRLSRIFEGTQEDMNAHLATFKEMPIWPADGSVRVSNNEVIIKIGN